MLDISHSLARAEAETSVRTGYGLQKNLAESILKNHKKGGIHSVECGSPASRLRCTKILKHSKLSKQSEVLSTMKVMKVMKVMNPMAVCALQSFLLQLWGARLDVGQGPS